MRIDANFARVFRADDAPVDALDGRWRSIELLLVLACGHEERQAVLTERVLVRSTRRDPKLVRRDLRELERHGVVRRDGVAWELALMPDERIDVVPRSAVCALAIVQRSLVWPRDAAALARTQEERAGAVARAELAMARGEIEGALDALARLADPGKDFANALFVKLGKRYRREFMSRVIGVRGTIHMNAGRTEEALRDLRHALAHAEGWAGAEEWQLRLHATSAAVHRMGAALERDPSKLNGHLAASAASFSQAQHLADHATTIDPAMQLELRRWVYAEGTTVLALRTGLALRERSRATEPARRAEYWLGRATEALGKIRHDPSAVATTHMVELRLSLLRDAGRTEQSASHLRSAATAVSDPLTPSWARGWLPRYEADFAYIVERDPRRHAVRTALKRAWELNAGFGFQQLLILARLASWNIPPNELGLDANDDARLWSTLQKWHRVTRRRPIEGCPRCEDEQNYLARIRCTLRIPDGIEDDGDPLRLGAWR